jgi:hypothetical protein
MTRSLVLALLLVIAGAAVLGWYCYSPRTPSEAVANRSPVSSTTLEAPQPTSEPEVSLPAGFEIRFVDVTQASGIDFHHFDGRTEVQYIMDQTGSGLGWLDFDQDGLMDLFLVQGAPFQGTLPQPAPTCKLFKNLGKGRFRDVTHEAGLEHLGCGQGMAVGDIDNDGYPDLFLTYYGKPNVLYHNEPDGKGGRHFVDITARAGLAEHPDWRTRENYSTSAAFLDFNNDGHLDLFVCSYVKIEPRLQNYPRCVDRKGKPDACPPGSFAPTRCTLYRNNGNGTFTDVSHDAGVDMPEAKALGVVALDLDDDGLVDLFVANDLVPNFLFHNLGNGRFESIGLVSGCGVNLAGYPQAYMGVDADDLDGDGRPDLYVTAFARETDTLFHNAGRCQFIDVTHGSGIGPPSWWPLGFGTSFIDADRDGNPDVVVANGHVSAHVDEDGEPNNTFRQKAQFYWNDGAGHFRHISHQVGAYFQEAHVGRGLAPCDYDNDGHMDLAFNNSGEAAVLLHNETRTPYHWLRLTLRGTRSNRDAVGAKVTFRIGQRKLVRHRKGGGSYCSAPEPRLLVGLGAANQVDQVEIRWPSGVVQQVGPLAGDQGYLVIEGDSHPRPTP